MMTFRYAIRRLLHNPGFSAVVVATLALGIGANTAIFSIVNAVLLRPLPYEQPQRLVTLNHYYTNLDGLEAGFAVPTYRDIRERTQLFESFAVSQPWNVNLTGRGAPEQLIGTKATAEYFRVFGVPPLHGRTFAPGDDQAGHDKVIVLSYGFWQRRFGADASVVGSKLLLDAEPYDVIGVMPATFHGFFNRDTEVWAPAVFTPEQYGDNRRTSEFLAAVGRLKPAIAVEQASRDVTAFADGLRRDFPDAYSDQWTIITRSLNEMSTRRIRTALLVLVGAVGFVLLIACANIANLLLARAASRSREIAVRAAVGATRGDLVRQLLAESVIVSLVGAAAGLAIAFGAVEALLVTVPVDLLRVEQVRIDGTVLLFTLGIAIVTGLLFGLAPAINATGADLNEALRDGARTAGEHRGQWLRRSLVVAEMALALTLLVGAGLLIRSFARLQGVDPGFDPQRLVTMRVSLPRAKYETPESRAAFFEAARTRVAQVPGVIGVGATSNVPFGGSWSTSSFSVEGYQPPEGQPGPWGDTRVVTPGYHEAMRMKLLRGRYLLPSDREGAARVVVVDDEMVRRYWPDSDPIGKRISFGDAAQPQAEWIQVVGVVEHTAHEGLDAERRVQLYFAHQQRPLPQMTFAVRSSGDPSALVNALRSAVRDIDADQPIASVRTMDAMMDEALGQRKLSMYLLGAFAGIAVLLAAIGIYGVMSFDVTRRSQELGVRMALGAARSSVLALVLKQGLALAVIGIVLGLFGALALTRVIEAQLFGVSRTDPATFAGVALTLTAVAVVATLIPALRATRLDPVRALRYE